MGYRGYSKSILPASFESSKVCAQRAFWLTQKMVEDSDEYLTIDHDAFIIGP
jgi:hypothetical protein